jgi:ribose/xylose/arabinose/galactoside ABC-type transport system permease subunit
MLAPASGLIVLLILAVITTPQFYSDSVARLVLFQIGLIGLTALGQTFVLLVGGIDLSVGGVVGLTTVIIAVRTGGDGSALPGALVLALAAGALVGVVNAVLVLGRDVPPFVATFAVFVLIQGVVIAWTKGAPSGNVPDELSWIGTGDLLGVPTAAWLFAGLALLAWWTLAHSTAGRRIYAAGGNRRAADLSGIRTWLVVGCCYLVSALLAVLAGLVNAGYIGYVDAQLSRTMDLNSIAAAVVGGVGLAGGKGRIEQTVLGVLLLAVMLTWLVQLGAGAGAQMLVSGVVILGAVWLQNGHRRPLRALRAPFMKGQTS